LLRQGRLSKIDFIGADCIYFIGGYKMNRSIGLFLLQISVALYLFVNGILGFSGDRSELAKVVREIFGRGDFSSVLNIIFSVCAIIAGVFLLLELFSIQIQYTEMILFIFVIIWIVYIVLVDIINPINQRNSIFRQGNSWIYLQGLASHLMVLGALLSASKKFG
jgi:hypothetical protein